MLKSIYKALILLILNIQAHVIPESTRDTITSLSTLKPGIIVPPIVEAVQTGNQEIDKLAMVYMLSNAADKEAKNEKGEIVNHSNFNLNMREFRDSLESNEFLLFDIIKQMVVNIFKGFFNFIFDGIRSFFSSPLSDFYPDPTTTTVFDFAIWILFRFISLGLALRALIFFTPIRFVRGWLLRIQTCCCCV